MATRIVNEQFVSTCLSNSIVYTEMVVFFVCGSKLKAYSHGMFSIYVFCACVENISSE